MSAIQKDTQKIHLKAIIDSPHQVGWLLLFSIGPVELMSLVSGFIVIYSWIM